MPKSETSLDLSSSSSEASYDSDEDLHLAQKEWEESLEQLQQLVSVVLLPFIGKWLGRRWSQWGASSMMVICKRFTQSISFFQLLRAICDWDWGNHSFWGHESYNLINAYTATTPLINKHQVPLASGGLLAF
jgi:hypothetical protein